MFSTRCSGSSQLLLSFSQRPFMNLRKPLMMVMERMGSHHQCSDDRLKVSSRIPTPMLFLTTLFVWIVFINISCGLVPMLKYSPDLSPPMQFYHSHQSVNSSTFLPMKYAVSLWNPHLLLPPSLLLGNVII